MEFTLCLTGCRLLIGPPVGGGLYNRFGFRGPFIFGIITAFLDLVGRFLVIERKHAILWDIDTSVLPNNGKEQAPIRDEKAVPKHSHSRDVQKEDSPLRILDISTAGPVNVPEEPVDDHRAGNNDVVTVTRSLSLLTVVIRLSKSSRALVAFFVTLTYG
jgi:DHA1 family solute carrier family 18 vesicular amine transporter 1/2